MKSKIIFQVSVLVFFLSMPMLSAQIDIVVSVPGGAWSIVRNASNLTGGAGTDFVTPVDSASDLVDIAIAGTQPNGRWRVDIRRTDTLWHANLLLYARRTTDGTPGGGSGAAITGGTTYLQVTTTDQLFFNGRRTRTGIKVQLRIDGLSVAVGPNTYTTTITYTAVDD